MLEAEPDSKESHPTEMNLADVFVIMGELL